MWQDWAIAGIQLVLVVSFLSTVFHATHKPTLLTCLLSASCLFGFMAVYITLHFWFAVVMSATLGILWTVVGFQRYRLNKKH